jgi:hypothetical protein
MPRARRSSREEQRPTGARLAVKPRFGEADKNVPPVVEQRDQPRHEAAASQIPRREPSPPPLVLRLVKDVLAVASITIELFGGFLRVVEQLRTAGCLTVFLDASFITAKPHPGDFDGIWDLRGVDPGRLDPVLLDFENKRAAQKVKYFGEMFVAQLPHQLGLLPFFQKEKTSDLPKGIIRITLAPVQGAAQ